MISFTIKYLKFTKRPVIVSVFGLGTIIYRGRNRSREERRSQEEGGAWMEAHQALVSDRMWDS